MNLKENIRHQDLPKGNKEDDFISEDSLRQLCKTLTKIIPKNEAGIKEDTLMYLFTLQRYMYND